ncbi:hypothetical protein JRC04_01445 [Mycolicibacterium sp. S2-37]|uniref:hypothetical protein n=1 Tax=Mycolicibacterium sp. S2-37 TaxID=2810297 RepID=UPI001A94D918|nr:hypothetical protein [Mycolicibacterium sp. S2-37]MBO0676120.1 hypothetical protein [Mycolicibacterium sp. S2-37]
MRYLLIALYLGGWILTTVMLLRRQFGDDDRSRRTRMVFNAVSVACALALAAVWPVSAWFLPMIRAALGKEDRE